MFLCCRYYHTGDYAEVKVWLSELSQLSESCLHPISSCAPVGLMWFFNMAHGPSKSPFHFFLHSCQVDKLLQSGSQGRAGQGLHHSSSLCSCWADMLLAGRIGLDMTVIVIEFAKSVLSPLPILSDAFTSTLSQCQLQRGAFHCSK